MSTMHAREHAGAPATEVNIYKKQSFKEGHIPRVLDEDYFLYSLKGMFKDNLNEYPNKQLDRPNKFDLTIQDDRDLDKLETKKWEEHDLLKEQRKETFKYFTFPKHMTPQEKCVDQLHQDYEDFHMLCLRDMFHDRSTDLPDFDRTPAQDRDELKEMNLVHETLLQEEAKLPKKKSMEKEHKNIQMHKKVNKTKLKRISPKEKRTIVRQTKTTTTRIFKKPISEFNNETPMTKTEIVSETFTKPMEKEFEELPINDPKSKPILSSQTSYTVDLSQGNNYSWVWDNGQIRKC